MEPRGRLHPPSSGGGPRALRRGDAPVRYPHPAAAHAPARGQPPGPRRRQGSPQHGRGGRGVRPDRADPGLQPQHRGRFLAGTGQRGVRRDPLRQGAGHGPAGGARVRRRRPVHGRDAGTELAEGPPHPDARLRAGRAAADVRRHGRHRRAADAQVGAAGSRGPDRRLGQRHPPDAGHDRPVLVQLPVQQPLPRGDASLRRGHGPRAAGFPGTFPPAPRAEPDHAAQPPPAPGGQRPHVGGRRPDHQRPAAEPQPGRPGGHPGHHAHRGRSGHGRTALRGEHPQPDGHLPDRRP